MFEFLNKLLGREEPPSKKRLPRNGTVIAMTYSVAHQFLTEKVPTYSCMKSMEAVEVLNFVGCSVCICATTAEGMHISVVVRFDESSSSPISIKVESSANELYFEADITGGDQDGAFRFHDIPAPAAPESYRSLPMPPGPYDRS